MAQSDKVFIWPGQILQSAIAQLEDSLIGAAPV